jgi:hypothetical protein
MKKDLFVNTVEKFCTFMEIINDKQMHDKQTLTPIDVSETAVEVESHNMES